MSETEFQVDQDKLEVTITRVFSASPERLWRAYSDPEEIPKWWANTEVDKLDFKVGGVWRLVSGPHAFGGEFKEIDEPKKVVRTFEYELMPGHVMVESVTLEPQSDGKTKVVTVSKFADINDLNGMVSMGMEQGASAGIERLANLVETPSEK